MATLTVDEKRKLDSDSPTNHAQVATGKFVAFAHGSTGAYGTTGAVDVTIAGVEATDTVLATKIADDTTGAGTMIAAAGAGKITITLSEVTTGDANVAYVVYKAV